MTFSSLGGTLFGLEAQNEQAARLEPDARLVRAFLLKSAAFAEIPPSSGPWRSFLWVVGAIALKRYRQTLD